MSRLPWLAEDAPPEALPPPEAASSQPNGLLAVGGSLEPEWLLHAYTHGAFPWYNPGEPILWWSPDPRSVMRPGDLRVSRSLRRSIRRRGYRIEADTDFRAVIAGCAAPRDGVGGTWITRQMKAAYCRLHAMGYAHSFEAWREGELVGGLYGIAIDRVFFGESMFTRATDASKVAFAAAVEYLRQRNFELIDCQVESAHMNTLGAGTVRRTEFVALLDSYCRDLSATGSWSADFTAARSA